MSQLAEQDDAVDLGEIFAAIFLNWLTVAAAVLGFALCASYYASDVLKPEFEVSTRFELLDSEQGNVGLGQASGLAALAGLALPASSSESATLNDRILSRPFVDAIFDEAEFISDPVFNAYIREPGRISKLKERLFGADEDTGYTPERADYLVMAVGALTSRMTLTVGANGIIELRIQHPDLQRAAFIANLIVEKVLQDVFERKRNQTRDNLNYFAEELLRVRSNLDAANAAVRDYAIDNSLQSAEELARTSSQLSQVRREIEVLDLSIEALGKMSGSDFNGPRLAEQYPISTSLSFRRLLDLTGNPNEWLQPSEADLLLAVNRVEEQRSSLISSFNSLEARAKRSGAQAFELSALRREVEVQQTLFQSVITQFEAQSLFSGFEQASGRIVESAIALGGPTSPNKRLITVVGALLGLFLGIGVVLTRTFRAGRLCTPRAIKARSTCQSAWFATKKNLGKANALELSGTQKQFAQDFLVSLSEQNNTTLLVSDQDPRLAFKFGLSLAKSITELGETAALVNLAEHPLPSKVEARDHPDKGLSKAGLIPGADIISVKNPESLVRDKKARALMELLSKDYTRVLILVPQPGRGTALFRIFSAIVQSVVVIADRSKTTQASIEATNTVIDASSVTETHLITV